MPVITPPSTILTGSQLYFALAPDATTESVSVALAVV
jgi:hypothetical protein